MSRFDSETPHGGAAAPSARLKRSRRRAGVFVLGGLAGLALLLGVLNFYARASASFPDAGVLWLDTPEGVVAVQVDPSGPAAAAGVRPGDRLESLDGQPPASAREAGEAPWRLGPGESVSLALERGGRQVEVLVRPELREGEGQLYAYLATVGLFFLASGIYLVYRLGLGAVTLHYFFLSLAAFAVLTFSHTGEGGALDWLFYTLDTAGRLLFPALMLHFALRFPASGGAGRAAVGALYAPAAALAALALWLIPLRGALRTGDPVASLERLDAAELLYTAAYLTACLVVLSLRSSRTVVPSVRRQLRWVSWGLGMGMMPFVVLYLIPRALRVEVPPAASLSVLPLIILPLAFSTAILKYRLADLGLFVKSGVTALTLTFFSLALFVLLNLTLRQTLGLPGINNRVFTVLAGVLVFLLYPPLRKGVGALVDRAFYLGHYDYRRTLLEFVREINSERELGPLLARFHDRIRRTLPLRASVLFLPEEQTGGYRLVGEKGDLQARTPGDHLPAGHPVARRLAEEDSVLLDREARRTLPAAAAELGLQAFFPMRVKGRVVAVLAVALRDPEEELNSEDLQLLTTLAAHAAAAIEGARLAQENLERIREVELLKDFNESIVESSRVGILVLDARGRIRGWNRAMEDLFGQRREAVLGRRVETVFPAGFDALLAPVPPGGRRYDRHSLPGEDRRTFNLAVSELRGKTGDAGGRVVTFDEVSEQVRMEQQLVQSERLAAVGLLASGVAHEINTPLTGISSYAEMLLEEINADDSRREILERIKKQSWRASHIANSLLNFSRGSGGDFEKVDLYEVVEETLSLFEPQLKGRRIRIRHARTPGPRPLARGHRGRLQQVLLNLLLNARDALPAGGEIRITTSASGGTVGLEVADTGEGIPQENLDRIYDPFFTTKGSGKGTGLGLSVTYGIVRDHGGTISVDSRPGHGTRFLVGLPAWQAQQVPA